MPRKECAATIHICIVALHAWSRHAYVWQNWICHRPYSFLQVSSRFWIFFFKVLLLSHSNTWIERQQQQKMKILSLAAFIDNFFGKFSLFIFSPFFNFNLILWLFDRIRTNTWTFDKEKNKQKSQKKYFFLKLTS